MVSQTLFLSSLEAPFPLSDFLKLLKSFVLHLFISNHQLDGFLQHKGQESILMHPLNNSPYGQLFVPLIYHSELSLRVNTLSMDRGSVNLGARAFLPATWQSNFMDGFQHDVLGPYINRKVFL